MQGIDPDDDGEYWLEPIDWDDVDERLKSFRDKSMDFLNLALK